MKIIETKYLNNGKGYNFGQSAKVVKIEDPSDYNVLLENIISSGYYNSEYFKRHLGYDERGIINHFWFLAEAVLKVAPKKLLEVGCGRGDVLHLLKRRGIEVHGVDFSEDAIGQAHPSVISQLVCDDILSFCQKIKSQEVHYDTLCGFDIWEHLHPNTLDQYIASITQVASDDAFAVVVIPAFGNDTVFGEQFPLELEENRVEFDKNHPFSYLLLEKEEPVVPALGHLIWAPSTWWQNQFEKHGWIRVTEIERDIHSWMDPYVPHSIKAFYIFRRDTNVAKSRASLINARGNKQLVALHHLRERYFSPDHLAFRDNPLDQICSVNKTFRFLQLLRQGYRFLRRRAGAFA